MVILKTFISLFSSVAQSCVNLCDPIDCSTPDLPVYHQPPEFTQTHVHWVGDAIQPPHPLSSPSPPAFNPSQHQGLFQWVSSLHQVAKVLEFSFSISPSSEHPGPISFRMDWLDLLPRSKRLLISCYQLSRLKEFQVCRIFLMHILEYKRQKVYQWEETQGLKRLLIPYLNKNDNYS